MPPKNKKERNRISIRLTEKNEIYLSRLGFIDLRSGNVRKNRNINRFINECITMACENGWQGNDPESLIEAYIKFEVAKRNREIERLRQEIIDLIRKRPAQREYEEAINQL